MKLIEEVDKEREVIHFIFDNIIQTYSFKDFKYLVSCSKYKAKSYIAAREFAKRDIEKQFFEIYKNTAKHKMYFTADSNNIHLLLKLHKERNFVFTGDWNEYYLDIKNNINAFSLKKGCIMYLNDLNELKYLPNDLKLTIKI